MRVNTLTLTRTMQNIRMARMIIMKATTINLVMRVATRMLLMATLMMQTKHNTTNLSLIMLTMAMTMGTNTASVLRSLLVWSFFTDYLNCVFVLLVLRQCCYCCSCCMFLVMLFYVR